MKTNLTSSDEGYLKLSEDIRRAREKDIEQPEVNFELETTSRSEYISAAYYAIAAVSELDVEIMHEEDRKRKKSILRKSLRIIDNVISELDAELFDDDEFEEENY